MPCYDGRDEIYRKERSDTLAKLEAILCTLISLNGLDAINKQIKQPECGVRADWLKDWWAKHQEQDRIQTSRHFGASK